MANVKIKYLGGIEDEKQGSSLTGSATLMTADIFDGIKVLIDFGMNQGGLRETELNNKVDEQAIEADFLVVTHAHMDHIGRLPLLVKKGFKGEIVTSNITKQLMVIMLSDYVKLTKDKIESLEKDNKIKGLKLRRFLKLIKLEKEIKSNGLKKEDKQKKENSLSKIVGKSDLKKLLKEAREYLKKMDVKSEEDIEKALNDSIPTLLYDMDDVYKIMSLVSTLEVGEEMDLINNICLTRLDSEIIDKIPEMVKNNEYDKSIFVMPNLKNTIISKWNSHIEEVYEISKQNKELRIKLRTALGIKNKEEDYGNNDEFTYSEAVTFLDEYNIFSRKDIDKLKDLIPELTYTKEDVTKATDLLKTAFNQPNEKVVEAFKLRFYDAGHIEGSVSLVITAVTKKIEYITGGDFRKNHSNNNVYKKVIKEHKNFGFSGDRGKTTDPNLSGIPENSDLRLDYYQSESTYSGRNHPSKDEEFMRFLQEINSTEGKVLIPAFSMQRIQEIVVELIQNKINNKNGINKLKKVKKEFKKLNILYKGLLIKGDNLTDDEKIERDNLFNSINKLSEEMNSFTTVFLDSIILDSPLGKRVSDVFLENLGDKYKLLDGLIQKELFGKEIVRVLEKGEYKNLYTDKRSKSKEVIISSGGMLQGGAVINHLKEIIGDPYAKIIFTGYQSIGTIGNKILTGDKQVIIEGEIYDVKCKVTQVKGYSSHIGHDDLVEELGVKINYSKKAILALNHGGPSRTILADAVNNICSRVNVVIPNLYDEIVISL